MTMLTRCMTLIFVVTAHFSLASEVRADIYRYVDENGVVHFTNRPTSSNFHFFRKETLEPTTIDDYVRRYAELFNLEEALVRAVIRAESNFNPQVVSHKGAIGLMQLMPATAAYLNIDNPRDPEQNIRGGTRYLRMLLDQFEGDLELALAAYNAGPNTVVRFGGIPPYPETRTYVTRVKQYLSQYR
ncbi:lytic transglycosylase domain-containing protein [Geoalkalibacter halelectricus]|uniref:Lytic transglycosylase domain-containing protein n=2 Tax=Geoalkalibacter halelectricus TaxID=2847045 RepID=A0ABY5ZND4_9BACT|nr:lytic transglycosylase domain-containing protein [Geoalkalibacter halelectricus]UWZ80598.1 lytic transglycosylase domain-containing protein [Geoalkalibacter halelectricus]